MQRGDNCGLPMVPSRLDPVEMGARTMTLRELANLAVDLASPLHAARLVDAMRARGFTYACVLAFVQRSRPNVTPSEWDALLYQADEADASQ